MRGKTLSASMLFSVMCCANDVAQTVDKEPAAVIEIGCAVSKDLQGGKPSFGPNFAVEVTPIENWLELEVGVTPTFRRHSTEWGTDFLFKKPWTLSKTVELMFGVGPEWVHASEYGTKTNSLSGEAVLDFMFWPSKKHKFGWYIEPGYEYSFARGHEKSINISGGLLIAIP